MNEVGNIKGTIDNIYTKTVNTKFGDKDVYHAVIGGYDVNLGFKNPYSKGESVTMTVENSKYGIQLAKAQNSAAPDFTVPPASSGGAASSGSAPNQGNSGFPVRKGTKDIAIVRQNSAQHASRIVAAEIAAGMLKQEDVAERFMTLAYEISDFSTGHREEKLAAAMAAYNGPEA